MDLAFVVERHALAGLDKQLRLQELVGGQPWAFAMDDGLLRFGERHAFAAQVLGTESHGDGTWLWAWANAASGIPDALLRAARRLRAWGEEKGCRELVAPSSPLDRADGQRCALVASGLFQAAASYRGPYDGGALFLLVTEPRMPPMRQTDAARATSVISQGIAGFGLTGHRRAIDGYLRWLGWPVEPTADGVVAADGRGGRLVVAFDAHGRLAGAEAQMTGAARR